MTPRGQETLEEWPFVLRKEHNYRAIANALGGAHDQMDADLDRLSALLHPVTALDHLGLYEKMLGLTVDPPGQTIEQRRDTIMTFLQRSLIGDSGLEWESLARLVLGNQWSYTIQDPKHSVIVIEIAYAAGSLQAVLAETLLRSITPASCRVNVVYAGGFLLDISRMDDDLLG